MTHHQKRYLDAHRHLAKLWRAWGFEGWDAYVRLSLSTRLEITSATAAMDDEEYDQVRDILIGDL